MQSTIHRRYLNHIAEDETKSLIHMVLDVEINERKKTFAAKAREIMNDNMHTRTMREWLVPLCHVTTSGCRSMIGEPNSLLMCSMAGLAVGVMVIPQGMSYAKLSGLPVEYGLYSALLFPVWVVYALFGSSRQLAIGLVTLQQLGFVTIFLSNAVISGFIVGAAIIIGLSQVNYIFGVKSSGNGVQEILKSLFADIDNFFNYKTFLMGTGSIVFLMGLKHAAKVFSKHKWIRAVGPITITMISISITCWAGNVSPKSIPVVGTIPAGFPAFTGGLWAPIENIGGMLSVALSITIIGFMESVAIAKKLAVEHKYEIY